MIIGRIDSETSQISSFVGDVFDNDRDIAIEANLDEGDYAIYLEADWNQPSIRDIVVSCYGSQAVAFSEA